MRGILATIAGLLILKGIDTQARQSTAENVVPRIMTLPEAVEFVRPSVVQMTMNLDNFSDSTAAALGGRPFVSFPLGTGFFVNEDGYVITALHVVRAFQDFQIEGRKRLFVALAGPNLENIRGNFGVIEFDIVDEDVRHDLVLLKLKRNPFKGEIGKFFKVGEKEIEYDHKAAILSPGRPRDGEAIAVSGYPLSSTVLITNSGSLASSWSYDIAEVQIPGAPVWFRKTDVADSYLADVHVNGGNSGGPVYSVENGRVIGVCVAFDMTPVLYGDGNREPAKIENRPIFYNSGLTIVVPVRYVIDLLKKHNLKWAEGAR